MTEIHIKINFYCNTCPVDPTRSMDPTRPIDFRLVLQSTDPNPSPVTTFLQDKLSAIDLQFN